MITDKQLQIVANILDVPLSAILLRKALEAYEASKWVDTEKSLPSKTGNYVTDIGLVHFDSDEKVWCAFNTNGYPDYDINLAYWQPLPTFKE